MAALSTALAAHAKWVAAIQASLETRPIYAEQIATALSPANAAASGYTRLSGLLGATSGAGDTSFASDARRSVDDGHKALSVAQTLVGSKPKLPPETRIITSVAPAMDGGVSCDVAPGSLYERFVGTTTDDTRSFDVRVCVSGGSWYYGSTDSSGGGVSNIHLEQVGPGQWQSTNGAYLVTNTAEGLGCVSVFVSGQLADGYPACGSFSYTPD